MKDKVYKLIELTGSSTKGIEDAVSTALKRAGKTIQNLGWFEALTWIKLTTLIVNLGIVAFMTWTLWRSRGGPAWTRIVGEVHA